ncbi:polysaccharide deacetylase family protein [Nonomuraea sp. NPDC000554]|uniref:polysaccharide deacetylase family protein n=1 Tax=Nonomuraea sp. NPDC000554 TaxID=3154259 RepID=UPI0033213FD1
MHKSRFFGGIVLLAVSVAGCSLGAASPHRDLTVPGDPTMLYFVDPASVPGLTVRTLTEGDSAPRYVHVSYPELAAAPQLSAALHTEAERQLRGFRGTTGAGEAPPRPELNVEWQLAAASGGIAGVRMRTSEFHKGGWGNSIRTFWYDGQTGKAFDSTGLLKGQDALRDLTELVREQLRERGPQVDRNEVKADRDEFDALAFNRSGDLVVEFDDCQIGACSLGRLAVAVPSQQAEPLLSESGRRAQQAVSAAAAAAPPAIPGSAPQTGLEDESQSPPAGSSGENPISKGTSGISKAAPRPPGEGTPQAPEKGSAAPEGAPTVSKGRTKETPLPTPEAPSDAPGTVDCDRAKCVALTFDDGPGPNTGRLLDELRAGAARATFFVVGSGAAAQPDLLRRMAAEGHLVGNHSWNHRDLSKAATSKITDSLRRTQDTVRTSTGQAPTLLRPPYGAIGSGLTDIAKQLGLALVTWDVDTGDQQARSAKEIADRAVEGAHPGAVILMHDVRRAAVDAVPEIIERLRGKGYTFVTVPDIHGGTGPQPGLLYG